MFLFNLQFFIIFEENFFINLITSLTLAPMKKIILLLIMLSSLQIFSQSELRVEYNYVIFIEKGKPSEVHEGRTVFFFNYKNEHRMKLIRSDGKVVYYSQIGDFKKDVFKDVKSNSENKYQYAKFINDNTDFIFTIKIFDDPNIGCIMQVDNSLSIQYLP